MAKKKQYTEGELITLLNLNRIKESETSKMQEWLDVSKPILDDYEQRTFDDAIKRADKNIDGWNEEDLKMKFLSHILPLGHLVDNGRFMTYYEKKISGVVDGIELSVKTDFMVAKGVMSFHQNPYFHFHAGGVPQYKPQINPAGEPMAQLVEAMLIAQEINKNGKPIYGAEIIGQNWKFVIMQGKDYCISRSFDSIDREDLFDIIAILRKFKHILETELLD